ncbi:hypothetical protein [Delftia deserti]|uniref:Virion morphogenesis protein n=1 Tax=Delftia deserti TaxID=1651218 RepID=A0ABW5F1U1_9BURK
MADKFSQTLAALCNAHKERMRDVVQLTMLNLFSQCVDMSPVGNPDIWKANAGAMAARDAYREEAFTYNAQNPGKKRKGTGRVTVSKKFPLSAGKGYTGGRFKNNWQVGIAAINPKIEDAADGSGSAAMARARAALITFQIGHQIFIGNNLPYAKRLEFGWSKQAPSGMIRLSIQNTQRALSDAIAATKGRG